MPNDARYMIKTALVWLCLALVAGVASAAFGTPRGWWPGVSLYPTVLHLITVGWLTQLIFGVAYWLFPRWSRDAPHGPYQVVRGVYVMLNAGLVLRVIAEPFPRLGLRMELLVTSSVLQAAAAIAFAVYMWNRVKVK